MNSLKKALACIFMLAIIFVSFSCSNGISPSDNGGSGDQSPGEVIDGNEPGKVVDGLKFDLSNAKSFFAGKASGSTASRSAMRAIDDNSVILMKITDDGTISPAMDFQGNGNFDLKKILKNPVTKELFLLGEFNKWSSGYYDNNGNWVEGNSWSYRLIRIAQNGTWYGLPDFYNIQITQEPFDEQGNFYFQRTDYNGSTSQSGIYKYSGGAATKIADKAELERVLPNGAIIYSVKNQSINYNSYYYLKLKDGNTVQLDDYSASVYVSDKNIFYYNIKYIRKDDTTYYVDDDGNKYSNYDGGEWVDYANKGGKKIYVTQDGDSWKDENGKTYDSHVFSGYETRYWNFNNAGKKIYLTNIYINYYVDSDGNKYDNCDKSEYVTWYYVVKNGKKIEVEQFLDDSGNWRWKDGEGNTYDTYDEYENYKYYVFDDNGKKIEVEHIYDDHYEDDNGNKYDSCDKSEHKQWYWVYDGGELVKVENNNGGYYYDKDGNEYFGNETFQVWENYVTIAGEKVTVKPAQTYSTDVIVAKYYDFLENKKLEAVEKADFSTLSYDPYKYDSYFVTSSENVFGSTFITNSVWKFEIQKNFSLKCEYNLSEKGYSVATVWNNDYSLIGENSNRYLEKFLYSGEKIYFLGTKETSWSNSDSTYNLYKIVRFGEPQTVLSNADASNYSFNGSISFSDDGNFIGSVLRKSDGKWGTLSGSMEYGTYEFKENSIFESVKEIVINFD